MNSHNKTQHSGKPSYLLIILKHCKMLHENSDSCWNKKMMIQVISEPIKQSALLVMVITMTEKQWVKPKADGRHEMKSLR